MYQYNLIVYENLPQYVTFLEHYENNIIISFNQEEKYRRLKWDLGKLKKGQEFIINYLVKITSGKPGDVIESNEIYKEALNYDMKFDEFDITNLINNTKLSSKIYQSIFLNQKKSIL